VSWFRDTGGTLVGDEGSYSPAFERYSILDGVVTGPDPVAPGDVLAPPTVVNMGTFVTGYDLAPDGTARLPWNGFAGEGITMSATDPTDGQWTMHFPGGSCLLATVGFLYEIQMVSPSPDGTKVAIRSYDFDGGSTVEVKSLVDGATCPSITHATYQATGSPAERAGNVLVWSPDSSRVAYGHTRDGSGIAALPATAGSTPVDVVTPAPGTVVPMGWSVAGRLLYSRTVVDGASVVSRLITRAAAGGPERVLDTAAAPTSFSASDSPLTRGGLSPFLHYGYFVPGTSKIVFNHGSSTVTDAAGYTFPRFYVALVTDATGASSRPILGSKPPLTWHQEALTEGAFEPPFDLIDVPDAESVNGFVH
jgi:hypothetical protein